MSESVVSFTKQTSQVTPYWLLQQLAAIDAVLIFKFADKTAYISYDVPAERTPRDDYLCRIFNGASDDFKLEYVNEIWDSWACREMNARWKMFRKSEFHCIRFFRENSKMATRPPPVSISSVNRSTSFPALSNSVHRSIFNE